VQIISFEPPVPVEETELIKAKLREFTERVNNGSADFSMLARLYSEDVESAKRGGELGFVGRGQLVPEFAEVAFNMNDPKRVSKIVKTEYGYHIIQFVERKGERVNCKHILMKPRVSGTDKVKALEKLDTIAQNIRDNKITFEQAVIEYSQDKNTVLNAGIMMNENTLSSKFEFQELPIELAKQIYSMKVGEISSPFVMLDPIKHKEVMDILNWAKLNNHLNFGILNFVISNQ
jgi:peptidyl-prolyl cis-trans isomerase SurA